MAIPNKSADDSQSDWSQSTLKCYSLSNSPTAFTVKGTPQIGYEAVFVRLEEDDMQPDMLLTMYRTSPSIHSQPRKHPAK